MEEVGKKFDGEKPRYELLSPFAIEAMVRVLSNGARKYGDHNWRAGITFSRIIGALNRHIAAIERGEDYDVGPGGDGELHSAHILCEAMFLTEYYNMAPHFDNRALDVLVPKRVGLDVDDVLADFVGSYCDRYGLSRPRWWNFDKKFCDRYAELVEDKDFWMSMKPLNDPSTLAFEPVCYITARGCPKEWTEEWLANAGFPSAPIISAPTADEKATAAKEKQLDIFVDDCYSNFVAMTKAGIFTYLYTRTHNARYDVGHRRVDSLSELFRR